jgi:hypothetical protein
MNHWQEAGCTVLGQIRWPAACSKQRLSTPCTPGCWMPSQLVARWDPTAPALSPLSCVPYVPVHLLQTGVSTVEALRELDMRCRQAKAQAQAAAQAARAGGTLASEQDALLTEYLVLLPLQCCWLPCQLCGARTGHRRSTLPLPHGMPSSWVRCTRMRQTLPERCTRP